MALNQTESSVPVTKSVVGRHSATASILIDNDSRQVLRGVLPDTILVLSLGSATESDVTATAEDGTEYNLKLLPTRYIGLYCKDQTSELRMQIARARLEDWTGHTLPDIVVLGDEPSTTVAADVIRNLSLSAKAASLDTVRLHTEFSRLRNAHEELQQTFADVERFVAQSNLQPARLAFQNDPVEGSSISGLPARSTVTQILPVSTFGLNSIQLHLASAPKLKKYFGGLHVSLYTIEDHTLRAEWDIPTEQLSSGWLTLPLPRGFSGQRRTPKLVIKTIGNIGELPPISLGSSQPLSQFCASVANSDLSIGSSLAVRCWVGLPGVTPPTLGSLADLQHATAGSIVREVALPLTLLEQVKRVPSDWQPDFEPVKYLPAVPGLECHPPPAGVMVGSLADFAVFESCRISAQALVRSEIAKPIEFAIAVSTLPGEAVSDLLRGASDASSRPDFQFSGWVTSSYSTPAILSLFIPDAFEGQLYFATRMANGAPNDFGWAAFRDVRLTLLGKSVSEETAGVKPARPLPDNNVRAELANPVPKEKLRSVENVLSLLLGGSPATAYNESKDAIFCHPPQVGMTFALVRDIDVRGRKALICEASLGSRRALPVEFGVIATKLPLQDVITACSSSSTDTRMDLAFSGWHRVSGTKPSPLMLNLKNIQDELVNIYFATRMIEGSANNNYAWAYFSKICVSDDVEVRSEAAE
jgi:hypothetical protein